MNLFLPNNKASKYIKQELTELGETETYTIILNELYMPLRFKQKIQEGYARFNMNESDLMDIQGTLCPITPFSCSSHRSLTNTGQILSRKENLNQFLKAKIVHSIFYDLNKIKLGINNKEVKSPSFRK